VGPTFQALSFPALASSTRFFRLLLHKRPNPPATIQASTFPAATGGRQRCHGCAPVLLLRRRALRPDLLFCRHAPAPTFPTNHSNGDLAGADVPPLPSDPTTGRAALTHRREPRLRRRQTPSRARPSPQAGGRRDRARRLRVRPMLMPNSTSSATGNHHGRCPSLVRDAAVHSLTCSGLEPRSPTMATTSVQLVPLGAFLLGWWCCGSLEHRRCKSELLAASMAVLRCR
jgi:hypothetical protein